jgi:hypothetical protein
VVELGFVDLGLVFEVEVKRTFGDTRFPGNLIHDAGVKSPTREDGPRSGDDFTPSEFRHNLLLGLHRVANRSRADFESNLSDFIVY